jgi:serine O-acetyltransferase
MKDVYVRYLEKFLDVNFIDYPRELVADSFRFVPGILEILRLDISAKYPRWPTSFLDGDALFYNFYRDVCIEAVFYYRLERAIFNCDPDYTLLPYLATLMRIRTGMELYYSTEIGPGFEVLHGSGIVIGPRYKIGTNFKIYQGVTLGQKHQYSPQETIIIGNNVSVFSGAKILGNVQIGDNVQIAANSVLLSNAESNSVYAGIPARRVKAL